jgi:thiamine pyrophosphate-dependent acetolactate synthase large subunit-like protein
MFASRMPIYQPRSHLKAIESAAMGFAFPSALGAKLAAPDREVVSFVGDGDFLMTAQDLETAVREKIPVTSIVFNNFGMAAEKLSNGKIVDWMQGVSHNNPDFGKLAALFGGFGATVKSLEELGPAFEAARKSGLPAVLDVHIDPHELPQWMSTPWKADEPASDG